MTDKLATASDHLASASTATTEHGDRLDELADQLDGLAAGSQHADHGRLARIQAALDEIQPAVSDDVAATIKKARDEIRAYRETIDGV